MPTFFRRRRGAALIAAGAAAAAVAIPVGAAGAAPLRVAAHGEVT